MCFPSVRRQPPIQKLPRQTQSHHPGLFVLSVLQMPILTFYGLLFICLLLVFIIYNCSLIIQNIFRCSKIVFLDCLVSKCPYLQWDYLIWGSRESLLSLLRLSCAVVQSFSSSALMTDILPWMSLCWGEAVLCIVHCRLLSSIHGLYPLDSSGTPISTPTLVTTRLSPVIGRWPRGGGRRKSYWWSGTYLGRRPEMSCLILERGAGQAERIQRSNLAARLKACIGTDGAKSRSVLERWLTVLWTGIHRTMVSIRG